MPIVICGAKMNESREFSMFGISTIISFNPNSVLWKNTPLNQLFPRFLFSIVLFCFLIHTVFFQFLSSYDYFCVSADPIVKLYGWKTNGCVQFNLFFLLQFFSFLPMQIFVHFNKLSISFSFFNASSMLWVSLLYSPSNMPTFCPKMIKWFMAQSIFCLISTDKFENTFFSWLSFLFEQQFPI